MKRLVEWFSALSPEQVGVLGDVFSFINLFKSVACGHDSSAVGEGFSMECVQCAVCIALQSAMTIFVILLPVPKGLQHQCQSSGPSSPRLIDICLCWSRLHLVSWQGLSSITDSQTWIGVCVSCDSATTLTQTASESVSILSSSLRVSDASASDRVR